MTSGMPAARTSSKSPQEKDLVARLTGAGEEALQRLSELPGGKKALQAVNDLRARVDELASKVRGIDELEARVTKLEKELASLKRGTTTTPRRSTTRRPST